MFSMISFPQPDAGNASGFPAGQAKSARRPGTKTEDERRIYVLSIKQQMSRQKFAFCTRSRSPLIQVPQRKSNGYTEKFPKVHNNMTFHKLKYN
jgi:hypothetical protein